MKRVIFLTIFFCFFFFSAIMVGAIDRSGFDEVIQLVDSAKVMEADVFSPKNWKKASKAFSEAQKSVSLNKKQKTIDKHVSKAREYVEHAIKATEVGKLTLQEYLEQREKAKQAKAAKFVPELYLKAEVQFKKATAKVESGNVKNALKEVEKAMPLYNVAELEAIRVDILGAADRLIEKAMVDDAGKYALSTLNKARTARKKANAIINNDRYNRTEATKEAQRAEYEARHATNFALSVRSLKRNDQAWEKLMLLYEIQMNRVGNAASLKHLPFDNGPLAAADTLIYYINNLKAENERLINQMDELSGGVSDQLKQVLSRFDDTVTAGDPVMLVQTIDQHIKILLEEKNSLANLVETSQSKITELSDEHQAITAELSIRMEREKKFKKAKMMLNPSEGEVLFNSSNDIVLRLSGLSFDVGKSEIQDEHIALLEKVKEVIKMFPEALLVIEGHTDASGDASANVLLSEKRAFAVMQYLRQSLLIPADRIRSMGFGADKPVASNKTSSGRAKNRRIDIIVMR